MKKQFIIIGVLLISFQIGCNTCPDKLQGILNVEFKKTYAVGPDGLICIVRIKDIVLKKRMIEIPGRLRLTYSGGIYNIDSLYFPAPFIDIYDHSDSTLVLGQGVFCLKGYSESFMDSIIQKTREEISISFVDTLTNEKWIISSEN